MHEEVAGRRQIPTVGAQVTTGTPLEVIRSRIGVGDWPERDLRVCSVEAGSGTFTVFDRTSDVDLVHAVAASSAVPLVWPAVTIGAKHYIDGGMRSTANADLAAGADRVVGKFVLDPERRADAARTGLRQAADVLSEVRAAWL